MVSPLQSPTSITRGPVQAQNLQTLASQMPGQRLFDYIDGKNGGKRDGLVEWKEFEGLISFAGWNRATALTLWHQTDVDRSGTLDRVEWLRFCSRLDVGPYILKIERHLCGFSPIVSPRTIPTLSLG